jgi:acyl carrier protein
MTDQELLGAIAEIIAEFTGVPASDVTPGASLAEELDVDSLLMVEIAVTAQDRLGVEIPDDELGGLKTVQDVVSYVQRLLVSA